MCLCASLMVGREGFGRGNLLMYLSVSGSDFIINLVLQDRTILL